MHRSWKLPVQDLLSAPWSSGVLTVTSTMDFPTLLGRLEHRSLWPSSPIRIFFISHVQLLCIVSVFCPCIAYSLAPKS